MTLKTLSVLIVCAALSGCATTYVGDGGQQQFAQDKYQCSRETSSSGFVAASGSQNFVAAAIGAVVLVTAVGDNLNFRQCMQAHGWFPQASSK
jgi:hypothetical protein